MRSSKTPELPKCGKYEGKSFTVIDVMSKQLFVKFEDGTEDFVFTNECKELS